MNTPERLQRNRNRTMLLLIAALFLGSFVAAGILRFSGWRPAGLKNNGELLQPPVDVRRFVPRLETGEAYRWNPIARRWRILVAPAQGCAEECAKLSNELDVVWQLFGRDADRVHTLWLGAPAVEVRRNPSVRLLAADGALRAALPRAQDAKGVPVYVIDPNGFVVLRYAPGFDPADLRTDVARLLKLR